MTFWIILGLLTVVAILFSILPLLRVKQVSEITRDEQNIVIAKEKLAVLDEQLAEKLIDQDEYNAAKQELENSLAIDLENEESNQYNAKGKWLIYVILIFVPVTSFALYWHWGSPDLLNPEQKLAELKKQEQAKDPSNMSIDDMIAAVKKKLKANPEDGEGWFMLGRTFMAIQKYEEAVTAYKRSYELIDDNATIMLSLADALAMTQKGVMQGEPSDLVKKAIEIEPDNSVGLWLAGLASEQEGDTEQAYNLWSRLLPMLTDDPASAKELKAMLVKLKKENPQFAALPFNPKQATVEHQLTVRVAINDNIKAKLSGNEQVFIYAKAVTGPPMPLAARKMRVSDLPVEVILSDADAMMPQMKLSGFDKVTVGARVSLSGNPIPQSGDYFAEISPVDSSSSEPISVTIQQLVP